MGRRRRRGRRRGRVCGVAIYACVCGVQAAVCGGTRRVWTLRGRDLEHDGQVVGVGAVDGQEDDYHRFGQALHRQVESGHVDEEVQLHRDEQHGEDEQDHGEQREHVLDVRCRRHGEVVVVRAARGQRGSARSGHTRAAKSTRII